MRIRSAAVRLPVENAAITGFSLRLRNDKVKKAKSLKNTLFDTSRLKICPMQCVMIRVAEVNL